MADSEEQIPEFTLDTFNGDDAPSPDDVTDEQREFLTSKAEELDDATAEKYGIEKPIIPVVPEAKPGEEEVEVKPDKKDDDDLEIDEDEVKMKKIVAAQLQPLKQQAVQQANILEVDSLMREMTEKVPNVVKYRQVMLDTMKKPEFSRLTAKQVFNIVAGDELMRIGAAKERAAQTRADGTRTKGSSSSRSSAGGKKDWGTVSAEEFRAKQAEVLGRPNV